MMNTRDIEYIYEIVAFVITLVTMENKDNEMSEKETPVKSKDKTSKDETQGSDEALQTAREIKKELQEYRTEFDKMWKIYDDAYYGKQHKTGEGIKTVKNHIFKIIDSQVATLTDSMPSTQVTASREDKQEAADILGKAIKHVYTDQNLQILLPSLIRAGLTSGPGYLYVSYNPDADQGDGKIEYKQLPWKAVFLDGNAPTIEQSEKLRIEVNLRKDALIRTWPEKADEIKKLKGKQISDGADDANYEKRDISGRLNELGKPKAFVAKDVLQYAETWTKSYDLKDIDPEETQEELKKEQGQLAQNIPPDVSKWQDHAAHEKAHKEFRKQLTDHAGLPESADFDEVKSKVMQLLQVNPQAEDLQKGLLTLKIIDNHLEEHEEMKKLNPTSQEPAFKDGWRVIKTINDMVVVYDGENPEENGEIPLVPFYGYKDDTVYGFGEVKNIFNAQQTLNDVDFREFESLKSCANPGWIGDHEAEVDEKTLTNAPGIVILKKRGTELRRLEPGQTSPQLDQRRQADQMAMEAIAGQNEQSINDALPSGNVSGVTVTKLHNQAVGRIRLKGRGIEYYSMRRLALVTASFIINHWTEERELRLRTDDNEIESVIFNPLDMQDLDYSMDVTPGSMAGVDKDSLIAFYHGLLNEQHIDFSMFLAASPEFPGKHTLVKLLKEKNQQGQQIQQAQQQYEQTIQAQQNQLIQTHTQNIKLKGALDLRRQANLNLLSGHEKKVFKSLSEDSEANNLANSPDVLAQAQATQEQQPQARVSGLQGNNGAMTANQNNQGM